MNSYRVATVFTAMFSNRKYWDYCNWDRQRLGIKNKQVYFVLRSACCCTTLTSSKIGGASG